MDLHDVSGTSTGQTLPRERRASPGTHFVRQFVGYTHILLLFLSSTHYCPLFHPLLSEISSSSCKDLARGSAGSKTPDVVTICGWSAAGRRPTRILSYKDALHRTQCESIETTVGTRRLLWAGALLRMGDHRLPKRVMSGELENAGKRGPGGKEKEWTECVADDLRLFGVTGDWKTAALDPGAWYNTVQEGGCRFMAAWVREKENASNQRQKKKEAEEADKVEVAPGVTVASLRRFRAALIGPTQGLPKRRRLCR